jgi:hypothetical protein
MLDVLGTNDGTIAGFRAQPSGKNIFPIQLGTERWKVRGKKMDGMEDFCMLFGRMRGVQDGVGTSQRTGSAKGTPAIQEVQLSSRVRLRDVGSDSCL